MQHHYVYRKNEELDQRYRILDQLGYGAFSEVYRVLDFIDKLEYVLKVFIPESEETDTLAELRKELEIFKALDAQNVLHPHIARFYAADMLKDGNLYLKLEYIDGPTVDKLIKEAAREKRIPPIAPDVVRQAALELLDALAFLHEQPHPIVHRDIKPSNLILSEERGLVIVDFNVSKVLEPSIESKTITGTPPYAPPEIYPDNPYHRDWNPVCDLYAVGVVLYNMLTGQMSPFANPADRLIEGVSPRKIGEFFKDIDPAVEAIILRSIGFNPNNRYQSARDMREAILRNWRIIDEPGPIPLEPMTTQDTSINYVQTHVNNLLADAEAMAQSGNFKHAEEQLAEALRIVRDIPSLKMQADGASRTIAALRQSRVDSCLSEARRLLNDPEAYDAGKIGVLLDEVDQLKPGESQAASLRHDLPAKIEEMREKQEYNRVRKEVEALWEREDELIKAQVSPDVILENCYMAALRIAQQAASEHKGSLLLDGLTNDAKLKYDEARDRSEILNTGAATGRFKELVGKLNEFDPDKEVQLSDEKGKLLGRMPARVALPIAVKMAEEFAYAKAMEYLRAAEKHMQDHKPRPAQKQLEECWNLFLLDNETRAKVETYLNTTILPAISALDKAEALLRQAQTDSDSLAGWKLIDRALDPQEGYPWVPGVEEARLALIPRLLIKTEGLVADAKGLISEQHDSDKARAAANQALEAARLFEEYIASSSEPDWRARCAQVLEGAHKVLADCSAEDELIDDLATECAQIEGLIDTEPNNAIARWRALSSTYGDATLNRFPRLKRLRDRIEVLAGIGQTIQRLNTSFASQDLAKINEALTELESVKEGEKDKKIELLRQNNPGFRAQLDELYRNLSLRRDYLTGLETLEKRKNATEALVYLRRVEGAPNHPDHQAAQNKITEVESNLKSEKEVTAALGTAQKLLGQTPPKGRAAYEALEEYANALTRSSERIQATLEKARQAWEAELKKEASKALSARSPDAKRLAELALEIENDLPEPCPVALLARLKAGAAAALAAEQEHDHHWKDAALLWKQALGHDPKNAAYRQKWIAARKTEAEEALRRSDMGDQEARGWFDALEMEFPRDPEIREWKARYYIQRGQTSPAGLEARLQYFALARQALQSARFGLERMDADNAPVLKGRLDDLERKLLDAELQERIKDGIRRKLEPERPLADFEAAQNEALNLVKKYPSEEPWWKDILSKTLERLQELDNTADSWKRFDVRSKILILNPQHSLARQMLTALPQQMMSISADIKAALEINARLGLGIAAEKVIIEPSSSDNLGTRSLLPPSSNQLSSPGSTASADFNDWVKRELDVLPTQRRQVGDLHDRARIVMGMAETYKDHVPGQATSGLIAILGKELGDLVRLISDLDSLQNHIESAQSHARTARVDGDWTQFGNVMRAIEQLGLGQHRSVQALRELRQQIENRRKALLQLRTELIQAVQNEDLVVVDQIARLFETDEKEGDPQDEFGIRASLEFTDPYLHTQVRSWNRFKTWLKQRQEQVDSISLWLARSGFGNLVRGEGLAIPKCDEILPEGVVDWPQVRQRIDDLLEAGAYTSAEKERLRALEGVNTTLANSGEHFDNNRWYNAELRKLPLAEASSRLNDPRQSYQPLIMLAERLVKSADACRCELQQHITEAKDYLKTIQDKKRAWDNAESDLTLALAKLRAEKSGWAFPWDRNRPQRIQEAQINVRKAIAKCREVASRHHSLAGIDNIPELNG